MLFKYILDEWASLPKWKGALCKRHPGTESFKTEINRSTCTLICSIASHVMDNEHSYGTCIGRLGMFWVPFLFWGYSATWWLVIGTIWPTLFVSRWGSCLQCSFLYALPFCSYALFSPGKKTIKNKHLLCVFPHLFFIFCHRQIILPLFLFYHIKLLNIVIVTLLFLRKIRYNKMLI